MPCYIELNTNNNVIGVIDSATAPTEKGVYVETPSFLMNHFGDKYLGNKAVYEDKWEIVEKPVIPTPPEVEPLVQVLDEFQSLQSQVGVLKKELTQAHGENKKLQAEIAQLKEDNLALMMGVADLYSAVSAQGGGTNA